MLHLVKRSLIPAIRIRCPAGLNVRCSSQEASSGVPYKTFKSSDDDLSRNLPSSADVVIIGGGALGCSTLYHLTKAGVTNAVLLEKADLTAGTTWHTAGLVWSLRPNDTEVELLNISRQLMKTLEDETGLDPGWINNGGLFIASSKERLNEYKRLMSLGKVYGIESHVLSAEETKKLYPLMNVSDIYGTLYSPADGTIDPAGYCGTTTRAAKKAGAKIFPQCEVMGIQVKEDDFGAKRVAAVETDLGTIQTKCVVNCAGVWAPYIGKMAGVEVPLIAMRHAYVVTERIEGIQMMPNTRDHDSSVYLKLQGDALCVGGYEPNPIFWENVDKKFAFSLFELDWDVFSFSVDGAINRVPAIEKTGIKSTVCGPESFTADHKPLMGEAPEVRGFYLGCGFNSAGMMFSGGCGKQLASWIIDGKPELDMYSYDIRRFPAKFTNNRQWVKERSHEAYAKNYSIVFPHDEPLACRNLRKDALHEVLTEAGCIWQERHGWERPGWFTNDGPAPVKNYDYYGQYENTAHQDYRYYDKLKQEYSFNFPSHHNLIGDACLACREKVAIFDMSYFGKYFIVGPDSQKAVDWIFTNDMTKPPGSTVYTCMLNKRGGVEADLTVSHIESGSGEPHNPKFEGDGFYLAVGGAMGQYAHSHVLDVIQDTPFNCHILDHTEDLVMLSIQGPKSRELLQAFTDTDLSNEGFPFSTSKVIQFAGHSVLALRLSFVGELGWELHVPNNASVDIYKAIMEEGAKHGIANAGYRAIDSLSIEKGYRHWHADLRPTDTPLEAGLAFTCKLKSEMPFLGREALIKQKADGLKKRIACFTIDDHIPLDGLEAIWRDNEVVGVIRRADYAFALGKSIAYGYIHHPEQKTVTNDFLKTGQYAIEHMGEKYPAQIHLRTPFDPKNERVKGNYSTPLPIRS